MRKLQRLGLWGLGAAVLLGWTTAGPAASDDTDDKPARPAAASAWYGHLFGGSSASAKKPGKEKDLPPQTVTPGHAPLHDEAAAIRGREEDALLRRMAVCDKLKAIAERNGDTDLERLAEQLEQRANNVYFQRIADLPASKASPDLDEYVLDKHQQKSGTEALRSAPLPHTVSGADARRATAREEEP